MKSGKLYAAMQAKNAARVASILQAEPAMLKKRSRESYNYLHVAAIVGSVEICNLILQAEAEHRVALALGQAFSDVVAEDLKTPLDCAVFHCQINVVRMFLNLGHNPFDNRSYTLNRAAESCQNEEIWDLLLEKAPLDFFVSDSAAKIVSRAAQSGNIFVIHYLKNRGLNIHQANSLHHFSFLHDAAVGNKLAVVKLFISLGLNVNSLYQEETALQVAAKRSHKEIVRVLLFHNADGYLENSQQCKAYERGCFAEFWEAGYPSYPSKSTREGIFTTDVFYLDEMDVDTTQPHIAFHHSLFPSNNMIVRTKKSERNKTADDPSPFYRTILTNVGIILHNVRQRVFLDALSVANLDLAVIMVQDYQAQPYDGGTASYVHIIDPKSDWEEIIEAKLYSLLRSKALSFFKAIAIAARWNVDDCIFHQITKKDWSEEKVTFFHEVVSGRFSLTSEGTNCRWDMYSPHDVEKTVLPIIKFLVVEIGADVNGSTSDCHVKPLYEAVRGKAPLSVIKLLLELGADVNGRNWKGGKTALHACCAHTHCSMMFGDTLMIDTLELLLQAGADQDCQDDNGFKPKDVLSHPQFILSLFGINVQSSSGGIDQKTHDRILAMLSRYSKQQNEVGGTGSHKEYKS